ncbi:MAG TPA: SRPBCC family protein [Acidimicrobiales bacterium]|nr:SRPBCC family protein [Acidimicrobiales bacterium]
MVAVTVSIEVDAPRPAVWAELERLEDHVAWMRDATAIRFVGDRRRGVGTTFECDTAVGPIRLTDVMEVTSWETGSTMAVVHRGIVTGSGRFTLEDGPGTATTLRWSEQLHFPWWLGGPIGARVAKPVLGALWRGNLRRLRARIDGSGDPAR